MKVALRWILVVGLIAVLPGLAGRVSAEDTDNPFVSKKAPDFVLETVAGGQSSLVQTIQGKPAIVFFWATWCPHCQEQLKELNAKKKELADKGVVVTLVDIGEKKDRVEKFLKAKGYDFNVFLDQDSYVAQLYEVVGIPMLFFVDADGKVKDVQYYLPGDYLAQLK